MKRKSFPISGLRKVDNAPPPDVPPLFVGDRCALNSGGPSFLIVDTAGDEVVAAWPFEDRVIEQKIPRACVRRVV